MAQMQQKNERWSVIGVLVFWVILLILAIFNYDSLGFKSNSLIMVAFWAASIITVIQWLFCIGLPAGATKHRRKYYIQTNEEVSENDIKRHRKQAAIIAAIWMLFLVCEGIAIHLHIVDQRFIIFGMIILRCADRVFVLTWCPFGAIMRNRCCADCRIYGWDQLMLNSPMLFYITTALPAIMLVLAAIPFVEWEIAHWSHPERFYPTTNKGMTCSHCNGVCGRCKKNKKSWSNSLAALFFISKFHKFFNIFHNLIN